MLVLLCFNTMSVIYPTFCKVRFLPHLTIILLASYNPTHRLKNYQNKYKNLSNWLKANKLKCKCFNVKETELVTLRQRKLKINHSPKFKLEGKRLVPTHSDKYLEVLINEHLIIWNKQITQIIIWDSTALQCYQHAKKAMKQ